MISIHLKLIMFSVPVFSPPPCQVPSNDRLNEKRMRQRVKKTKTKQNRKVTFTKKFQCRLHYKTHTRTRTHAHTRTHAYTHTRLCRRCISLDWSAQCRQQSFADWTRVVPEVTRFIRYEERETCKCLWREREERDYDEESLRARRCLRLDNRQE